MAFVDLEKAFDIVLRAVIWCALRCLGVEDGLMRVIKSMYKGVTKAVKYNGGVSKDFEVSGL
jgi:hypothetical protein